MMQVKSTVDGYEYDIQLSEYSGVEIRFDKFIETRYIKPPKSVDLKEHQLFYAKADKLANDIVIEKNQRYTAVVNGTFIFGDFIEALISGGYDGKIKTQTERIIEAKAGNRPKKQNSTVGKERTPKKGK